LGDLQEEVLGAKNVRGLTSLWRKISSEVAKTCGKGLMDHALKYLRGIGRMGVKKAMVTLFSKGVM
jgi:hypothetical protein